MQVGCGIDHEAYAFGWKANIAMAFIDTVSKYNPEANLDTNLIHKFANEAAENFINQLIKE